MEDQMNVDQFWTNLDNFAIFPQKNSFYVEFNKLVHVLLTLHLCLDGRFYSKTLWMGTCRDTAQVEKRVTSIFPKLHQV